MGCGLFAPHPRIYRMKKEIINFDTSKASQILDLPTEIIKENVDIFTDIVLNLKLEDMTPIFKNGDCSVKGNYRPVSIL